MKKHISLALAAVFLLTLIFPAFSEEGPSIEITPRFLAAGDWTSSEWYEDHTSRTLLATCTLLDLLLAKDDDFSAIATESLLNNAVYVGKKSLTLYIFFYGDEDMVFLLFKPLNNEVDTASILGAGYEYAESCMDGLRDDGLIASYYQIDAEDILSAYEMIISD